MTAHHAAGSAATLHASASAAGFAPAAARPARGMGRLATLGVLALTGVVVLAAAYLTSHGTVDASSNLTPVNLGGSPQGPAPIVGQAAPELSATRADGSAFKLSDLKGQYVWLTFGASWCQPCRAENADVEATYEAFKAKGVVVVQVFMDEDAAAVKDYAGRVGLTYQQVPDPTGQLSTNYRILGIPTHFFIDRDGVLRQLKVGTLQAAEMAQVLTDLGAGS